MAVSLDDGRRDEAATFAMRFTATPRGARLARRLAAQRLDTWGFPRDGEVSQNVVLCVAELCANAVRHGLVAGRDFHLAVGPTVAGTLRVEVSDACGERRPVRRTPEAPEDAEAESGRGLLLVEALAERWGVAERGGGVGKTVWCEVAAGT